MQAQSRLAVTGMAADDEHEAVIRELTRGRQLTARLRAEALSALRGQGQAEATAALILQEVSRAFNVCLSIMSSPSRAPPPPEIMPAAAAARLSPTATDMAGGQRRNREDSIPRECYYRCSFHRERNCRATKQVQQCSAGDPPQFLVMYFNEHTCDTAASWEPEASSSANPAAAVLDMSSVAGLVARRGVQEEHERQVLVDSLASVLGGQHQHFHQSPPPDVAVGVARTCDAPAPPAATATAGVDAAGGGMPRLDDVDVAGTLDVMDYDDVTAELCFGGDPYGLPDGGDLPFC
ncbi:hypothetical protein HU200_004911 [Digitaria exilis]|uniref:WRKY domain-containing protein n=1 Tax=Digitaria exilis TaxID=1010633 RepID=A0A835KXA9_9POAL|nr:hypothetical protein HU200_004911 [Digitaria exilis]CAB3474640.1 unnamed protein product [Digitaria exilis]